MSADTHTDPQVTTEEAAPAVESTTETVPVSEANLDEVAAPAVIAQEAKTVGDENLPDPREPKAVVVREEVDAQVVQPREGDSDKVNVHEVHVTTDEVITDPSSPLAVQVPHAGRGDATLPIHALGGKRPEDVFASEASKQD